MHYEEIKTLEDQVNTQGTKLWQKMNDNSKAVKMRAMFVQEHGGFFLQEGRWWKWKSPVDERNGYWLKRVDTGEKVFFENMTEFGEKNGLSSVKICELLNGKRKTYKGWTAVEIRAVKEGQGSFKKEKKAPKQKVAITKSITLIDTTTNQVIYVTNISQFAKLNNLDYGNLKKVAAGKMKSYKNLKLFNPLEKYTESPEG